MRNENFSSQSSWTLVQYRSLEPINTTMGIEACKNNLRYAKIDFSYIQIPFKNYYVCFIQIYKLKIYNAFNALVKSTLICI